MKKTILIILAFCICVSLSACAAPAPGGLVGTDSVDKSDGQVLFQGMYQYGNMQKNVPPGNFMLLGNEVLFTHHFSIGFLACSYNMITGDVEIYCKDASCSHDTCVARSIFTNVEVYEGKLYGISKNRADAKGPNQLVVVEGDAVKIITNVGGSFFHHGDKLYIKTADSSFMVLEEGEKEPRMILEEHTGYWHTIFGNYLYANTNSDIIRVDLTAEEPKEEVIVTNSSGITDGEYIYYIDAKTYYFYRCAMDGSNPELLVEQEVLPASLNFDDEYFYYRLYTDHQLIGTADSCDLYRFPKDDPTQIKKIITLPVPVYQVFTVPGTGKIFVTTHAPEGADGPIYVMNTDGSAPKILEMPEY